MDDEGTNATNGIDFEWDESKARANLAKHGVSFEEAKTVFNDSHLLTFEDLYHSENEQRYLSLGISTAGRLLVTVHTDRGDAIRLISSRTTTARERRTYEGSE